MSSDWLGVFFFGGWVGGCFLLAMLGLSLAAGYRIFEHLLTVRRRRLIPAGLPDQLHELLRQGRMQEAEQACRAQPSFFSYVLLSGLAEIDTGWSAVEKALEDATAERAAALQRRVDYLAVIGDLAPLLGLLGTVLGMMVAFETLAAGRGTIEASDLAKGIYLALATTAVGLAIGIPARAAGTVFRTRIDQLVAETAQSAWHAIGPLKLRRMRNRSDFVGPPAPPSAPEGGR